MPASDETDRFAHGDFWNHYSRSWDDKVKPSIDGQILGDEWTQPVRTQFVFERFAQPYLEPSARVAEIGPGGGKFSHQIIELCRELFLVDISREMLRRANQACGGRAHEILIEDGSLSKLESNNFDLVFSYDVFIHLESEEIFRYFAEVNRVLRTGGIFSIHTSNFESRLGFTSYLQQLRDHQGNIGTRYGGRMYPLTEGILRRFAEHSGFTIVDTHGNWEDKDLIFALRKTRPARPWDFVTIPDLYQRVELNDRVGGSDRRELYVAGLLPSREHRVFAIGDSGEPYLAAAARATIPEHACLAAPESWETRAGVGLVRYAFVRGLNLSRYLRLDGRDDPSLPARLGRLLEGLLEAHDAGLVHAELGPEFILQDLDRQRLVLFGLMPPPEGSEEDLRVKDLTDVAPILESIAPLCRSAAELEAAAKELADRPEESTLESALRLLCE